MSDSARRLEDELARALADVQPLANQLAPPTYQAEPKPPRPRSSASPVRSWSFGAAMEAVAPAPPPSRPPAPPQVALDWGAGQQQRRWPIIAAAAIVLLALAVFGFAVVRWIHVAVSPDVPAVTAVKHGTAVLVPVSSPAATMVERTTHFPDGTATVYVSVLLTRTAASPVLTFSVTPRATAAPLPPWSLAHTFVIDAGEATVVPIAAPSGGFDPGTYLVTAAMNGTAVGSTSFVVN